MGNPPLRSREEVSAILLEAIFNPPSIGTFDDLRPAPYDAMASCSLCPFNQQFHVDGNMPGHEFARAYASEPRELSCDRPDFDEASLRALNGLPE